MRQSPPPPLVPESAGSERKRRRNVGFLGVTKGETLKKGSKSGQKNPGKFYDVITPPPLFPSKIMTRGGGVITPIRTDAEYSAHPLYVNSEFFSD